MCVEVEKKKRKGKKRKDVIFVRPRKMKDRVVVRDLILKSERHKGKNSVSIVMNFARFFRRNKLVKGSHQFCDGSPYRWDDA